ncbi:MAG: C_GCAxxG_C_C family protein, partial [Bacteroidaceae bacterium]|nr:C_GCAxxG_C_C family protein [Bacteroidaceae bacterium]
LREVCGAVSGMFMVSSVAYQGAPTTDRDVRTRIYGGVQKLAERYRGECGSIVCRELLGLKQQNDAPVPEDRTPEYYKRRPCSEYVALAARMVGEYLNEAQS